MTLSYTGQVIANNQGSVSILITEPMGGFCFYRGENDDYGSFRSSFQRDNIGSLNHCKKYIQKQMFLCWFTQTPYYKYFISKKFMGGDFLLNTEAIAQHYGFATNYLDITCNIEIAEFFAYTDTDEDGNYIPISDFSKIQPCLYSSCGSELFDPRNTDFNIIGFQVLTRPMLQYAMAIDLSNPKYNYNNLFTKTLLPKDPVRARKIYEKFNGGEYLFPKDCAGIIENSIKKHKGLNIHLFNKYCKLFNINSNLKTELKNEIIAQKYFFDESYFPVDKNTQTIMQKEIEETIIPWINQHIQPASLCCKPI